MGLSTSKTTSLQSHSGPVLTLSSTGATSRYPQWPDLPSHILSLGHSELWLRRLSTEDWSVRGKKQGCPNIPLNSGLAKVPKATSYTVTFAGLTRHHKRSVSVLLWSPCLDTGKV
uniref:Uncharacterized protein n=1 Tax=Mus musculus TaxID=10090 RepID=Q3UM28_MOUSE|nr:unnamed protein product [Mus musculus]